MGAGAGVSYSACYSACCVLCVARYVLVSSYIVALQIYRCIYLAGVRRVGCRFALSLEPLKGGRVRRAWADRLPRVSFRA